MVKSTASESLDEAFEQRLTIIDEPWLTGCRLAETRLSRRDQHALRHRQRRPSSEIRTRVKSRKPLPGNKPEQNECTVNKRKQMFYFDGDQVHKCIQPVSDTPKRSRGSTYGKVTSSDASCPQRDHAGTPTVDGPLPSHHSNNMGNRLGDSSNIILDVDGQVFAPSDNDDRSTDHLQTHKRKLIDTCERVYNKRVNVGCEGAGTGFYDVITDEDKVSLKRQHDDGGDYYNNKRQRPQLILGQNTNDFDDINDIFAGSMSAVHSSWYEPQSRSPRFKRTLVNSARSRPRKDPAVERDA